jgi:hypothetical protein
MNEFSFPLEKFSVVQSDRQNRDYLNPLSDSQVSLGVVFVVGNNEEWGGTTCPRQVPR